MSKVKHFIFASCCFSDELTLEKYTLLKEYLIDVIEINRTIHPSYPFFVEILNNEIRVGCDIEKEFTIYNTMSQKTLIKIFKYMVNKMKKKDIVDFETLIECPKHYEDNGKFVLWQYKNRIGEIYDRGRFGLK